MFTGNERQYDGHTKTKIQTFTPTHTPNTFWSGRSKWLTHKIGLSLCFTPDLGTQPTGCPTWARLAGWVRAWTCGKWIRAQHGHAKGKQDYEIMHWPSDSATWQKVEITEKYYRPTENPLNEKPIDLIRPKQMTDSMLRVCRSASPPIWESVTPTEVHTWAGRSSQNKGAIGVIK